MPPRQLPPVQSEQEAEAMLRDGEFLWPGGSLFGYMDFLATKDEDFMPKEQRLKDRRDRRRQKWKGKR